MTFSASVKSEIISLKFGRRCCRNSFLYGMCVFGKSFSADKISFQSESRDIAALYKNLMVRNLNIKCDTEESPGGKVVNIIVPGEAQRRKVLKSFGHYDEGSKKINYFNFHCDECKNAFIAGAFLACGTVTDPYKDYHLEFVVPLSNLSKSFMTLLEEFELEPKFTTRNGYNIIYFGDAAGVEDILKIMGAQKSYFNLVDIEIEKDIRNKTNRIVNCENANINKMVRASNTQISAIKKIYESGRESELSPDLRQIAALRYANPDASLSELSALTGSKFSKSGINRRLAKIIKFAAEID